MKKKHVTFVTGYMGRGGAERVISILANYYAINNWTVDIAMILHSNVEYEMNKSINIVNLSSSQGIQKGLIEVLKAIRRFVKKENPDVIICFMAQICIITQMALCGIDIPIIMSERIDPREAHRNFIYRILLNHSYSSASKVVFQTERAKSFFNNAIQNNSCIIGNPINVSVEKIYPGEHTIVTAGRLTKQKNQSMLIAAFANLYNKHPEYKLMIYGDGPLKEDLSRQVNTLGLVDRILFPGNVSDLHERIMNAEIFVLPSNYEGLSNALLEAMMIGLPVIATNCAGNDELIVNNCNGILINVGDEEALTYSLEKLIDNESFRIRIAENGRQSVQRFRADIIIDKWSQVIESSIHEDCV